MDVLYLAASGSSDPTRASIPWHLAVNGSAEVGQSAGLVIAGEAAEVIRSDVRDTVEGLGLPPLRDLIAKASARSVPVHV